ncbi:hypothetical protein C8R44DRAFT_880016 [Mycena epipterygia]|nr:hypothetical protein C8R44DRAFT_880016 [Mycena epipterygia]
MPLLELSALSNTFFKLIAATSAQPFLNAHIEMAMIEPPGGPPDEQPPNVPPPSPSILSVSPVYDSLFFVPVSGQGLDVSPTTDTSSPQNVVFKDVFVGGA